MEKVGQTTHNPMPLYNVDDLLEKTNQELPQTPAPQTGTTLPFIWPPPAHLQRPPPFEEPVLPFPPAESLFAKETALDSRRCEEPEKYRGLQVYDSLSTSPHDTHVNARGPTSVGELPSWYVPDFPDDDTLIFESRFESGNLRSADKIDDSEYNLKLAFDINTDRHTQWFYFRVSNIRKGRSYKLNMQNLMKTEAVYNLGMQPLAYSEVRAEKEGVGWYRTGSHACYFKNQIVRAGTRPFWTLTFTIDTMHDQDTLYLAHCFPYTYTDLQRYLNKVEKSALGRSSTIRRRTLCQTLAGNDCDMLTITSPVGDHSKRKGIVISARVHPGETNASWMMKGVLDYLTSDNLQATALRDTFVFKVVPMLNPDGVIVGNYRCSLAGGDLNRQYEDPKRELFPEVMNLKQMIANFTIGKEVLLYVDLHGHSKKSNIFMYGLENPTDETLYMRERVIPTLLDQASPLFNLADCTFDVGKGKEGCGRVVIRKQLGIVNAFTMEASFMGADQGKYQGIHFNQEHYETMGHCLCETLLELVDPNQTQIQKIVQDLVAKYPVDFSRVVHKKGDNGDDGSSSGDSDSHVMRRSATKPQLKFSSRDKDSHGAISTSRSSPQGKGETIGSKTSDSNNIDEADCVGNEASRQNTTAKSRQTNITPQSLQVPRTKSAPAGGKRGTLPIPPGSSLQRSCQTTRPAASKGQKRSGASVMMTTTTTSDCPSNSTPKTKESATSRSRSSAMKTKSVCSQVSSTVVKKSGPSSAVTVKASQNTGATARRENNGTAGAEEERGTVLKHKRGGVGVAKRSKAVMAAVARKRGASGKGPDKRVPMLGPLPSDSIRRPASSPASRSISSPRPQGTLTAPQRSPSAPPKSVAASRRSAAATNDEMKSGTAKVKGGKAKNGGKGERPLPPLKSKPSSAAERRKS